MNGPIAYAAVATDGSESIYVASLREQAEAACREYDWTLIPLYAGPQTWQDETAAVEAAFERSGVKPTWPADEAGNIGQMAEAMAAEIERLQRSVIDWKLEAEVHRKRAHAAVIEIARLSEAIRRLADQDATLSVREGNVTVDMDFTLTDEEREAVEWFAEVRKPLNSFDDGEYVATLRKLLERLK